MKRISSIDIGSQTIRLLVTEQKSEGKLIPIYRDRAIVRLGANMNDNKILSPDAIERAVTCITSFVRHAHTCGSNMIFTVCTACVRNARNADEFIQKVILATGITPKVLSGKEEARLALKGVLSVFPRVAGTSLIIDIGGGSTELILMYDTEIRAVESIPLGVVGLAEKHLLHDPPQPDELHALKNDIVKILQTKSSIVQNPPPVTFLAGTAGTITTLAAISLRMTNYDPDVINGYTIKRHVTENLFNKMINTSVQDRGHMPGLEQGRAIVIIPGTAIVLTIMAILSADIMFVSDAGLLEGVLLDQFEIYNTNT
jgi:exopolyphosphatase / guanosine-5'-triphosphate,3'-diphosphate pyrophosphatase